MDNWAMLLEVTKVSGDSGQDIFYRRRDSEYNYTKNDDGSWSGDEIFGPRVQKVAVKIGGEEKHLWERPWVERFQEAGTKEDFKKAQLEIAIDDFLKPALKLCKKIKI